MERDNQIEVAMKEFINDQLRANPLLGELMIFNMKLAFLAGATYIIKDNLKCHVQSQ